MRNNKPIDLNSTPIGTRVKIKLPQNCAWVSNKEKSKKFVWRKGKLIEKDENGKFFTILVHDLPGRMLCNNAGTVVKCL